MTTKTKVYTAEYNSCVYESGFSVISLHETQEGAEKAVAKHQKKELKGWKMSGYTTHPDWEQWRVRVIELEE